MGWNCLKAPRSEDQEGTDLPTGERLAHILQSRFPRLYRLIRRTKESGAPAKIKLRRKRKTKSLVQVTSSRRTHSPQTSEAFEEQVTESLYSENSSYGQSGIEANFAPTAQRDRCDSSGQASPIPAQVVSLVNEVVLSALNEVGENPIYLHSPAGVFTGQKSGFSKGLVEEQKFMDAQNMATEASFKEKMTTAPIDPPSQNYNRDIVSYKENVLGYSDSSWEIIYIDDHGNIDVFEESANANYLSTGFLNKVKQPPTAAEASEKSSVTFDVPAQKGPELAAGDEVLHENIRNVSAKLFEFTVCAFDGGDTIDDNDEIGASSFINNYSACGHGITSGENWCKDAVEFQSRLGGEQDCENWSYVDEASAAM